MSPPSSRHWLAACVAALVLLFAWPTSAAPELDCTKMPCGQVLPGAASFKASPRAPFVEGFDQAGKPVGWVALSTDVVSIKGYSGKPLATLVGLTPEGNIGGAKVVHHSEPILLVGIPEQKLHDFVAFYEGKPAATKISVGKSSDPNTLSVDLISGATVTALAENETILSTARSVGLTVGVVKRTGAAHGHFVESEEIWSWQEMLDRGVFGRLELSEAQMGLPDSNGTFIDLYFTILDAPQIGRAILGEREFAWQKQQLEPGEHLLVVLGNGSSSFKGSGFVRGGMFDRVRLEQGLNSIIFTDRDYRNLSRVEAVGAPEFKEGAVFVLRGGKFDPGAPFDLVFLGSRYNQQGGFSRDFHTESITFRLPPSVYLVAEQPDPSSAIWRASWRNNRAKTIVLVAYLCAIVLAFSLRRFLTSSMRWLKRIHTLVLVSSAVGLGFVLHAQPSVTQLLTLVGSAVGEWQWSLFLTEPLLFVSWIFIAIVTLIWGRGVFCGWVCPYGALSELLFKIGRLFRLPEFELPDRWHLKLRHLRYLVLAALIGSFLYRSELGELLAEVEPFKTTFFVAPWARPVGFVIWWGLLLLLSFVWYRPFCRYLCPLGGGLALVSSFRLSEPYRRKFCDSCKICTKGCEPRAIDPQGRIDPRECLSCMECETNFRDETVCPPLVGIARLTAKRDGALDAPAADRLAQLQRAAKSTSRFAPELPRKP
ncbi:MAG: 4Fe-4S binding protein [Polyangiaceae bacterium]